MFDKERFDPHRVEIFHTLSQKIGRAHLGSEEGLSTCITDVLTKFQSISG